MSQRERGVQCVLSCVSSNDGLTESLGPEEERNVCTGGSMMVWVDVNKRYGSHEQMAAFG